MVPTEEVLAHSSEPFLDGEPIGGKDCLAVLHRTDVIEDLPLELRNSHLDLAVGRNEVDDERIFLEKQPAVDIERMLSRLVEHDEDSGVAAKALDEFYPVLRILGGIPFSTAKY